ncbi:ferredoxin--NADP+ reductase [Georgenia satyanarayanai]|uniref:ferredoxin--NADP(+) reductase n=1 Tax=Georgenia satyanarayanai TaxID=860221 RepID=A0A2Y9AE42_9MICO|nr:FAD-dependent oxidoreductase [Georgenia satyanarayanai]PYF99610.1 ferredoxin--NADP+ reductase [Georgenia satyanarayanai]SSA42455.1 ferredoxin--NADP+ reductase [Georgenia satyanarayanai]
MTKPLRVALIGAGPAGIYAADILSKAGLEVSIDLYERLPAPFGLVRYGVAPDHPRIKQIIVALQKILGRGDIRLIGNVDVGTDVSMEELRRHYDAVIISTGADKDAPLPVPGIDLPGSYGAADFVSWYDGHPDVPRTWPLEAQSVAVLGVGNVALDVARILAKHVEDLMPTEVPANVVEGLRQSPVTDVHVFGRRGPAQVKFTPLELRELGKVPDVDVIVYEEDFEFDEGSEAAIRSTNQTKQVVKTLTDWTLRDPEELTASRRIHLHFLHRPVEILGTDRVEGIRTERTELVGDGTVRGTGTFVDTPVQAVYRAVGYFSSALDGVAFDDVAGVVPNDEGRVLDEDGEIVTGLYATGWIKRGPVGLIGSTKSDAQQTIGHLVADVESGRIAAGAAPAEPDALIAALEERGVPTTSWSGWELLDAYERSLGEAEGRERVKVVPRDEMTRVSRGEES